MRLAHLGDQTRLVGLDLILADAHPAAVATADPATPAYLGAKLLAEGLGPDALRGKLGHQLIGAGVVLSGNVSDLVVDFAVARHQVEFLGLSLVAKLLHLQPFVDQGADGLVLDLRDVLVGGLNAGGDDQQAHALNHVVGRNHLVVHRGYNALRKALWLGRLRRRRR